jgi:hypothetical protein
MLFEPYGLARLEQGRESKRERGGDLRVRGCGFVGRSPGGVILGVSQTGGKLDDFRRSGLSG